MLSQTTGVAAPVSRRTVIIGAAIAAGGIVARPSAASAASTSNGITLVSRAAPEDPVGRTSRALALSDGGRLVVFESDQSHVTVPAVTDGRSHLYLRDVAAGVTRRVDPHPRSGFRSYEGRAALSGDGSLLAYVSTRAADGRELLRLLDVTSGAERVVPDPAGNQQEYSCVHLTRDGRWLTWVRSERVGRTGYHFALWRYDVVDDELSVVDDGKGEYAFVAAASSGDGRFVLAQRRTVSHDTLVLLDTTTGTEQQVSRPVRPWDITFPCIDDSGSEVVFCRVNGTGNPEVLSFGVASGETSVVSRRRGGSDEVTLSGDGQVVYFTSWPPRSAPVGQYGSVTLFRLDRRTGVTTPVLRNANGALPNTQAQAHAPLTDRTGDAVVFTCDRRYLTRDPLVTSTGEDSPRGQYRAFVWNRPS